MSVSVATSNSVSGAIAMRLAETSMTACAFGSVQNALPWTTGKFSVAGFHWSSSWAWKDTVPLS